MLLLDETPYQEPKDVLQVAPTSIPKAAGMAALKLPVDVGAAGLLIAGGVESLATGGESTALFELYDEEIKPIQDRLTPEPGSVTTAGQFVAGIAGFAPALLLGPAAVPVLAGSGAISTGADLVEQGVDPATATGAGILTGGAVTAMAAVPAAGKTWGKTLALAAFNPVLGAATTQAQKELLQTEGYGDIAKQYDPLDPVGRGIDAVFGVAFGAMGKYALARQKMAQQAKDSIDVVGSWQRMFKDTPFDTSDPKTADLGYKAMQKALSDISQGKPVDLAGIIKDYKHDATKTSVFDEWFSGSKVVDADNEPLTVYHGTRLEIDQFYKDALGSNTGSSSAKEAFFFTSNAAVASDYAMNRASENDIAFDMYGSRGANVVPVYLSLKNPLVHDFSGDAFRDTSYTDLIKRAKSEGRDGVIFKNTYDSLSGTEAPHDVYAVFDPGQIKAKYIYDSIKLRGSAAPVRAEQAEAKAAVAEALARDAELQEHRIDAELRTHVEELMQQGDFLGVMDLVYKDELLGTYNQKGWLRLERGGKLEGRAQGKSDLVKFKYLNDTYGDKFGDEVLAASGKYLSEQPNVKVFRIGGDETAVVSTRGNVQDVKDAYHNANEKLKAHHFTGKRKDGTLVDITGVSLIYGTGHSPTESAGSRKALKERLIAEGRYSDERGARPLSLVERAVSARDVPGAVPPSRGSVADVGGPGKVRPAAAAEVKPAAPKNPEGRAFSPKDIQVLEGSLFNLRSASAENYSFQKIDAAGNPTGEIAKGARQWSTYQSANPWLEGRAPGKAMGILDKALRGEWPKERATAQWKLIYDALDSFQRENAPVSDIWSDPTIGRVENALLDAEAETYIRTGTDADGNPVHTPMREFLDQAKREYKVVEAQQDIYRRIGDCLG